MVTINDRDPPNTLVITLTANDRDVNLLAKSVVYTTQDFSTQSAAMFEDGSPFFQLNSQNGEVRIIRQPNGQGPYLLTVVAGDQAPVPRTSAPFLLVVTVASRFDEVVTLSVSEATNIGTEIGTVQCSSLGMMQFVSIEEDSSQSHEIFQVSSGGSVTLLQQLDYEILQQHAFDINCTEGGDTRFASVRVSVTDANDNDPEITGNSGTSLKVAENNVIGLVLGNISFMDKDAGVNGQVTYRILPPATPVNVNSDGEIVMTASVNYEMKNMYMFTIAAVDMGTPMRSSTPVSFTLEVLDANDPPRFDGEAYVAIIPGHAEVTPIPLLSLSVSDDDSGMHDWENVSINIPWMEVFATRSSQQVMLKQYPAESLEVGSIPFLHHSEIFPYLDGIHVPVTNQSGLPVYLKGILTARDGGGLITSVPVFVVIFPMGALIKVTVTTSDTVDSFKSQAVAITKVFGDSLNQRTIPFQSRPAYVFTTFSIEQSMDEDNSLLLYGFFHNGTFVSGAIGVDTLPHNFHFLTESVARDVLVEDYTRTLLQSALGSSIDYSVQGATIASPTTSSPGPVGLSDAGIAGIVVATVIMTLIFASGIGLVIALLVK
jgi:hypothetical protein